jgi:hypothetical protein
MHHLIVCFSLQVSEQDSLQLNVRNMLEDEIVWLSNFVPSDGEGMREIDNALLAGHLQSIRTLLTCTGIDKNHFGESYILLNFGVKRCGNRCVHYILLLCFTNIHLFGEMVSLCQMVMYSLPLSSSAET